jgi:hypothetical protein
MIDFQKLAAPFPPSAVSWRVGSVSGERGMALAYLDARDVADRLDNVCNPMRWQCRYNHAAQKTVCEIGIFCGIDLGWVYKADGAGDSDIEAEKGALSDAFKRAAVRWGIGRYLYHLPSPWVEIEKRGKTSVIAKHEYARLEKILAGVSHKDAVKVAMNPAPNQTPMMPLNERADLPPPDPDVLDAATRWFRTQKDYLEKCQSVEAIAQWAERENRALGKLKLQHRDLWDMLDLSQQTMLDRLGGLSQ